MMNKNLLWALIIIGVVVVGGVAVFILINGKNPQPTILPTPSAVNDTEILPVVTPVPAEFTVTASNFKYDLKTIKVKKGDTVKIIFKNSEGFHDFIIDEFDVATNQIGAEEEDEVEFVADKVGTFEYYCSVGTHRKMGMVGKLIVE